MERSLGHSYLPGYKKDDTKERTNFARYGKRSMQHNNSLYNSVSDVKSLMSDHKIQSQLQEYQKAPMTQREEKPIFLQNEPNEDSYLAKKRLSQTLKPASRPEPVEVPKEP